MAISTKWAPLAFKSAFNGEVDFNTHVIKAKAFISTGWAYDQDTDQYLADLSATELSGGGYAVQTLSNADVGYDAADDRFYLTAGNVTFAGLTTATSGVPRYFVIYDDNATNKPIIAVVDLGDDVTGVRSNADLVLQWNSEGICGVTIS